ncbi:TPA: hypothetical protein DF272_06335 [Candidatus Falkowbacteria bacterium]|nr:hypothetical protein [Candidatus Falkowbacteria bacterium]
MVEEIKTRTEVNDKPWMYFADSKVREQFKKRIEQLILEVSDRQPRALIFIDRAARPLAWALKAAWEKQSQGSLPPIKFFNLAAVKEKIFPLIKKDSNMALREGGEYTTQRAPWSELQIDTEKAKAVWRTVGSDKELLAMMPDLYSSSGPVLVIDDYRGQGSTMKVARSFLEFQFPEIDFEEYTVFSEMDAVNFRPPKGLSWIGPWLPWNSDKDLTGVESRENDKEVISKRQDSPEARQKMKRLREEINRLFAD